MGMIMCNLLYQFCRTLPYTTIRLKSGWGPWRRPTFLLGTSMETSRHRHDAMTGSQKPGLRHPGLPEGDAYRATGALPGSVFSAPFKADKKKLSITSL